MRLAAFIRANADVIVSDWADFAKTLTPAAENMTPLALRDHIREILAFITADIQSAQTETEQVQKSHGAKAKHATPSAAETHASLRHAGGFNMDQMVAEYRALRASVIQLWEAQLTEITHQDLRDLTRFNESIDQALIESIHDYSQRREYSRNLFLGILSHDLRSPLATARMSAELAVKLGAGNFNERQLMLIAQVVECADRATEMTNYLLDLTHTRLGSGLPILKAPMDMGFVSKQLVDEMRTRYPDRIFTLAIEGNTEGEWDKPRIGQVFSNLLGNALQYGFADSPIDITVTGTPEEIVLTVHNEGVPIPPDTLGSIFESLIRGRDGTHYHPPGSVNLGLGLYITKEIVTAHKGTISVTSSEKKGTQFTIRFPRTACGQTTIAENGSVKNGLKRA